jgi:hypothetical protein
LGAAGLFGAFGATWIASLPPESTNRAVPRIDEQEADALLTALKPPKRRRPLIAIVGINDATETTDYLMPAGILSVATTTGISASMPLALTLIEAIAGRDKAEAVGREIGVTQWGARHDSHAFQLTRPFALTAIGNTVALWNREQLGLEMAPDVDEVSLARRRRVVPFSSYRSPTCIFVEGEESLSSRCHRSRAVVASSPCQSVRASRSNLSRGAHRWL